MTLASVCPWRRERHEVTLQNVLNPNLSLKILALKKENTHNHFTLHQQNEAVVCVCFHSSGPRLSSSLGVLAALWVVMAHAKDAPAMFNHWLLFCLFCEWICKAGKDPLDLVYPQHSGPFIHLDCGRSVQTNVQTPPGKNPPISWMQWPPVTTRCFDNVSQSQTRILA